MFTFQALASTVFLLVGCTADPVDSGTTPPFDSQSEHDSEDPLDTGETPSPDLCTTDGLTVRSFTEGGQGEAFETLAPDFTWMTLRGEWNFAQEWSGCDSYVMVNLYPGTEYPRMTRDNEIGDWLATSPPNVHYFFFSYQTDWWDIWLELSAVSDAIEEATAEHLDPELADHWRERIHFVTESAWDAEWVSALNDTYYIDLGSGSTYVNWASAIDRLQQVREIGYLCDPSDGWSSCPPWFLSYEATFFNFESDRQDTLDAEAETVSILPVFTDEPASDSSWSGTRVYAEVTLPDADTMATFDTLELDLTMDCEAHPDLIYCPDWDYLVYLYLCDADDPETKTDESESCGTEIGRWITTYWRPGRWVHDISPFLALLKDGGPRRLAFYTQQYYEISLDLRLSNRGKGARPTHMEPLFDGGTFNEYYNWGQTHEISETRWERAISPDAPMGHTLTLRDDTAGWLVAENDPGNPTDGGDWTRLDWVRDGETLHTCLAITDADSEDEAAAFEFACDEDDTGTKDDQSLNCSGADHDDLTTGCNGGAWSAWIADAVSLSGIEGEWLEVWHEDKLPITLTPPESVTQVNLVSLATGHGFGNTRENCAEFCDHQHRFTFNEAKSYTETHPDAGTSFGCAERVGEGVVPNQAGTWIYGRAGWCPGWQSDLWVVDVTSDVTSGAENTVGYLGLMDGEVNYVPSLLSGYSGTDASIRLNSYLVYYE